MYDIAVMITNVPQEVLYRYEGRLNFRLSYVNDDMLSWLAVVRTICLLVTAAILISYLLTSISWDGCSPTVFLTLNLDQWWVTGLLIACAMYDEPFFEFRRSSPSVFLAVFGEVPASLFFTGLLTYWLIGVTLIRVKSNKLKNRR